MVWSFTNGLVKMVQLGFPVNIITPTHKLAYTYKKYKHVNTSTKTNRLVGQPRHQEIP